MATDHVLAHLEWVRSLSLRLVKDAATADDLVQRAWMAARDGRPPREGEAGVRAWLGGLLRNLARNEHRQAARQKLRERSSRRDREPEPAPDDLLGRSEQLADVARRALKLQEPFRRTMLLRWFEGLTPAEIAHREGILSATVRTRLHRGLRELRSQLNEQHGGDTGAWAIGLIPFAVTAAVAESAKIAERGKAIALVATMLAGLASIGAWVVWFSGAGEARNIAPDLVALETPTPAVTEALTEVAGFPEQGSRQRAAAQGTGELAALPHPDNAVERAVAPRHSSGEAAEQVSGELFHGIRGAVVLPDGTPVPSVGVEAEIVGAGRGEGATRKRVTADAGGRFEIIGLRSGVFEMSITWNEDLPIRGRSQLATTEAEQRIEVDALIVEVSAMDSAGEPSPMGRVTSIQVTPREDQASLGSYSQGLNPYAMTHDMLLSRARSHLFGATGQDGVSFAGYLESGHPAGKRCLVLTEDPPAFGSVRFSAEDARLPAGTELALHSGRHDSFDFILPEVRAEARDGRVELVGRHLLPGSYRFGLSLENADPVSLVQDWVEVDVLAGIEQAVTLPTFRGGMVRLAVTSVLPPPTRTLADVEYREAGASDWKGISLVTSEEPPGGVMRNSRTIVGGKPAQSPPMSPGQYELRVTLKGHRTTTVPFRILEGQTEVIELTLQLADG